MFRTIQEPICVQLPWCAGQGQGPAGSGLPEGAGGRFGGSLPGWGNPSGGGPPPGQPHRGPAAAAGLQAAGAPGIVVSAVFESLHVHGLLQQLDFRQQEPQVLECGISAQSKCCACQSCNLEVRPACSSWH